MNITGTFLDEITHDIPSASWGEVEWAADFDAMRAVGIDTVILIRAGYRDRAVFNSAVLAREQPMRPAYLDLVDLYLTQAERCGMDFYFGIYDSGRYWREGRPEREVELNLRFTEEAAEKYAWRKAFKGWYMTHEIHEHDEVGHPPDRAPREARQGAQGRAGTHVALRARAQAVRGPGHHAPGA